MRWPTREGISVPVTETELPESRLNLEKEGNFNNHHNEWTRKRMGEFVITRTLRDLSRHQFVIPKDTHDYIHRNFDPPEFPTIEQAMKEVMDAYDDMEDMRVYLIDQKRYVDVPLGFQQIRECRDEYDRLR